MSIGFKRFLFLPLALLASPWISAIANSFLGKRCDPGAGGLMSPPGIYFGAVFGLWCVWMALRRPNADETEEED